MPWIVVAGAGIFALAWGCTSFGIQDNNVAREMLRTGDWTVPHLNGVPYLEKPPLLYWLLALSLRTFGTAEWVVRLVPALCFAGTLGGLAWIGRIAGRPNVGRAAARVMCSATGIVLMSRSLLFDVPLMCVLTWAFGCFLQWRVQGDRRSLRAFYAALACGVLTKGLLAIVLGAGTAVCVTTAAELCAEGDRRGLRAVAALGQLWDWQGLGWFGLIAVPWHIFAAWREPGFADFYFVNEHVRRFLGRREPHDFYTGPVYYYLDRLPMYFAIRGSFGIGANWCGSRPAASPGW